MSKAKYNRLSQTIQDFHSTVAALRDSENGCAWDLEQTFSSLARFMIEEAYEARHEMKKMPIDAKELAEELGDVLFQVVLNAQLAAEAGLFDLADVISGIDAKIVRRHPHVFGSSEDRKTRKDLEAIHRRWAEIKAQEKQAKGPALEGLGFFGRLLSSGLSPLEMSNRIGQKSSEIGFDWSSVTEVIAKLNEEVNELKEVLKETPQPGLNLKTIDELGDLFFTLVQVCRHCELDPEEAVERGNLKFLQRFKKVENLIEQDTGQSNLKGVSKEVFETYWLKAKQSESYEPLP